ncbi:MAG: right-handed parallel beta-helix repeat-containing protein [Bacteroidetes bacterium]|nr:right-handed parallel beta-helix repeat-containing protein [Bacteroidota bacterium]
MRFFLFFCTLITTCVSAQTQFYVSPAGNNGNAGSLLQPWQTVQHALDNAIPGCTINLMGGTYFENAVVSISGNASNPITLKNYNNQNVVIDGSASIGGPLLYIGGKNYFIVSGIEFSNYAQNDAQGILVDGNCDHITITDNKIHDIHFSSNANDIPNANTNSQPIIVYGNDANNAITNLIISGNEIYNCRTGFSEALAVNGNVDGFEIYGNRIHDNANIGIDIIGHEGTSSNPVTDQARNGNVSWNKTWNNVSAYATSAGIYVDGGVNCIIENNIAYGNGSGIEIGCEAIGKSASNITVRNNLIYSNREYGMVVGGYDYPNNSGKVDHSLICGNTIAENNITINSLGELVINYTENVSFKNNIVYTTTTDPLVSSEANSISLSLDFNLYDSPTPLFYNNLNSFNSLSMWQVSIGNDNASIFTDPLFVNPAMDNFRLTSTSPAIDSGDSTYTSTSGETDLDTMSRVQNGRVDIGADEYGTAVGISEINYQQNNLMFYENVGSDLIIHFKESLSENATLFLYNSAGKLVEKKEMKKADCTVKFNTTKLAQGIYFASFNGSVLKILR